MNYHPSTVPPLPSEGLFLLKRRIKIVLTDPLPLGNKSLAADLAPREMFRLWGQEVKELGGRLLGWDLTSTKIKNADGRIPTLSIKGEFTVFCPLVGCRLPGEVVEVGPTYALLSTYGIFTVLVENPGIEGT